MVAQALEAEEVPLRAPLGAPELARQAERHFLLAPGDLARQLRAWGAEVPREVSGREEKVIFGLPRELRRA